MGLGATIFSSAVLPFGVPGTFIFYSNHRFWESRVTYKKTKIHLTHRSWAHGWKSRYFTRRGASF